MCISWVFVLNNLQLSNHHILGCHLLGDIQSDKSSRSFHLCLCSSGHSCHYVQCIHQCLSGCWCTGSCTVIIQRNLMHIYLTLATNAIHLNSIALMWAAAVIAAYYVLTDIFTCVNSLSAFIDIYKYKQCHKWYLDVPRWYLDAHLYMYWFLLI